MKSYKELSDLRNVRVLVRADLDVAAENGAIVAPFRAQRQKPMVDHLVENGAGVVLVGHIAAVPTFKPLVRELESILGHAIAFAPTLEALVPGEPGSLQLLDNVRHYEGEKDNDAAFAALLSRGFDVYINNAFAVCHRDHASVTAITGLLPSYAGMLVEEETTQLQKAIDAPPEGKVIAVGGAKAQTKLPVVKNFLDKAEKILIGGVVANDILHELGRDMGSSLVDDNARELMSGLDLMSERLVIAEDFIISEGKALDIGPKTIEKFTDAIQSARMAIWNGPMGAFEDERFAQGTNALAHAIAGSDALSIIGGGDTISAVKKIGVLDQFSFVSTGGGAMLNFLAGERLPGLVALGYYA